MTFFSKRRVVVLGAGASCSYSDSPSGQCPPIANGLIRTFFNLDISDNRYVLIGHIINYVRDTRGIKPEDFSTWTDDIERFLTEIDENVNTLSSLLKNKKISENDFYEFSLSQGAYNQLIFLFASIFNEIQNGPVSIPYALLANELEENDTCITFNWDTLMDRALASTGNWDLDNGYALSPESIFDDGWSKPKEHTCLKKSPQYLKLHGSSNWLTPYSFVNSSSGKMHTLSGYALDKLYIFHKATKPYKTYENRYWGPYQPFSYCYYPPDLPVIRNDTPPDRLNVRILSAIDFPEHGKTTIGDKDVYSMPLIVPPMKDKQYLRYGKVFSTLWERAKTALEDCEELYIIGYSFPPTDLVSKSLFRDALRRSKKLNYVVILNPYPEKIEELFVNDFKINQSKFIIKKEKFDPLKSPTSKILSLN